MLTKVRLNLEPLTPNVGAVVTDGPDLRAPLDPATVKEIRAAVLEHGVVFFRGQDLTQEQFTAFMKNFGSLCIDPFSTYALKPPPEEATVHKMPTTSNQKATAVWHLDSTLAATPASMIGLRALELPPVGGDTCWGSMYAAYEALSAPLRDMLDGLTAEHSSYKVMPLMVEYSALQEEMRNIHPVVRVNPETGRKGLFVNELWTEKIVELSWHESDALLKMLHEHARAQEFTVRWKWRPNDLALWDNRSFQHYAVSDYKAKRVMQKSLVAGDRPYGPSAPRNAAA